MGDAMTAPWRFPGDVPGWLTEREARTLATLAAGVRVVEIGSYHGRSTVAMAQVAASLDSIDHHKGDAGSGPGGTLDAFIATIMRYGVDGRVAWYTGSTADVAPKLAAASYDLAFIDGAHDYANASADIAACLRLVRPGGVIALHDYHYASVRNAADRLLGVRPAGTADALGWFTVPAAAGGGGA